MFLCGFDVFILKIKKNILIFFKQKIFFKNTAVPNPLQKREQLFMPTGIIQSSNLLQGGK